MIWDKQSFYLKSLDDLPSNQPTLLAFPFIASLLQLCILSVSLLSSEDQEMVLFVLQNLSHSIWSTLETLVDFLAPQYLLMLFEIYSVTWYLWGPFDILVQTQVFPRILLLFLQIHSLKIFRMFPKVLPYSNTSSNYGSFLSPNVSFINC